MLTHLSKFDNYCQPKQLHLKPIEMFRHKFVHQIMLQTLNYSNTTRNESNIILNLCVTSDSVEVEELSKTPFVKIMKMVF